MRDTNEEQAVLIRDACRDFYAQIEALTAPLGQIHADRLVCAPGCCTCCRDDITVFAVEAENIRAACGPQLDALTPHEAGACAFLDGRGRCRIYENRPYVCRTQGLPLRWLEEVRGGDLVEYRDICPLNETDAPIEKVAPEHCWTLGPAEEVLSQLQERFFPGEMTRVPLRSLFD